MASGHVDAIGERPCTLIGRRSGSWNSISDTPQCCGAVGVLAADQGGDAVADIATEIVRIDGELLLATSRSYGAYLVEALISATGTP